MKLAAKLSLILFGLILAILLGETAARLYFRSTYSVPILQFTSVPPKHPFGWEGRQVMGDLGTSRRRILVVGDSLTHGLGLARDDEMYFSVLGRKLDAEVFAYGGSGFGTLQEYMVIDQYLPRVKPDLVVLQTCSNDFINNSWELESHSYSNNNLSARPYLETGRIRYRFPSRFGNYGPLLGYSRLAYWLTLQGSKVAATSAALGRIDTPETNLDLGIITPPLQRAIVTTETIIGLIKQRLGPVPLVAFASTDDQYWTAIFKRQGIPFLHDVPAAVDAEERRLSTSIRPDGAHWDARGHAVVGEALARWLSQQHLIAQQK
jgi:lysophospholipase L1-like esterase